MKFMISTLTLLLTLNTFALDTSKYEAIVEETFELLNANELDRATIIDKQRTLVKIAKNWISTFKAQTENERGILGLVSQHALAMEDLKLEDIESLWHDCGLPAQAGFSCEPLGHYSATISLMDAVVHPSTVTILMKDTPTDDQDAIEAAIEQSFAELEEVLDHLDALQ